MAGLQAIHSFGSSLASYLGNRYPSDLRENHACSFKLLSSGEMATLEDDDPSLTLGLYLYRITINEHMRNSPIPSGLTIAEPGLIVDLHYLAVIWSNSPVSEHLVAAWMMLETSRHPVMDLSCLSADGGWEKDETVQLSIAELSTEDLMRIWDSLTPSYRLSIPYVARGVRIESGKIEDAKPVVARRFGHTTKE